MPFVFYAFGCHIKGNHVAGIDISIVIVNWNTCELTYNCIQSIKKYVHGLTYEILVSDNGSEDGSLEMLRAEPDIVLIENNANLGFAIANNIGLRQAKGRYLLLLNSDTLVHDEGLLPSLTYMDAHPEVGMLGCRLLNGDGSLQLSCARFPDLLTPVFRKLFFEKIAIKITGNKNIGFASIYSEEHHFRNFSPDWMIGAFMLIKREAYEKVGGLDEAYFMYSEDMDWCYRFRQAGWELAYLGNTTVTHFGGGSSDQVPVRTIKRKVDSLILYFTKHKSVLYARSFVFAEGIAGLLQAGIFFLRRLLTFNKNNFSDRAMSGLHRAKFCFFAVFSK